MKEEKKNIIIIEKSFPIKIDSKLYNNKTLANIYLFAKTDRKFIKEFKSDIQAIMYDNKKNETIGKMSRELLRYLEKEDADNVSLLFEYPYYFENRTVFLNETYVIRSSCRMLIEKKGEYNNKRFNVEILFVFTKGDANTKIKVEIETESIVDIYFDDIMLEITERNIRKKRYQDFLAKIKNYGVLNNNLRNEKTAALIKNELNNKYEYKNCIVKVTEEYESYLHENDNYVAENYCGEYLFI